MFEHKRMPYLIESEKQQRGFNRRIKINLNMLINK